jgi:hypothetical protein
MQSRVSRTVKQPTIRHEARILQFLRGQPAILAVYGYGQMDHFKYMAMELLGPGIAEQQKDGAGVLAKAVIRIVSQAVRRFQSGLDTILSSARSSQYCSTFTRSGSYIATSNPTIFFALLTTHQRSNSLTLVFQNRFSHDKPGRDNYDPLKDRRHIVGSFH